METSSGTLITAEDAVAVALADAEERVNQTVYPGSAFTETSGRDRSTQGFPLWMMRVSNVSHEKVTR